MSTTTAPAASKPSILHQPKAVWAVAFASVIAFMGIGLVDPILKPIAEQLDATPSQVSLLFTSYMLVTGVAMLFTGMISSRIGAKKTLLWGLAIIVVFAAAAGTSDTINQIVGFRAGWGLGNALFIATALAAIVGAASGGVAQAIILYEAALGIGIAVGPLVGGVLGNISWRAPFFGVATLMAIAFILIMVMLPKAPKPTHRLVAGRTVPRVAPPRSADGRDHRAALQLRLLHAARLHPVPAGHGRVLDRLHLLRLGCGAGDRVGVPAPRLQRRFGTLPMMIAALSLFAVDLAAMALFTDSKPALVVCVVLAGLFLGVNNTLITETVMISAPSNVRRRRPRTASSASSAAQRLRTSPASSASTTCTCRSGWAPDAPSWASWSSPRDEKCWRTSTITIRTAQRRGAVAVTVGGDAD